MILVIIVSNGNGITGVRLVLTVLNYVGNYRLCYIIRIMLFGILVSVIYYLMVCFQRFLLFACVM